MTARGRLETFAPPDTAIERRPDGTTVLRSRHPLPTPHRCFGLCPQRYQGLTS